LSVQSWSLRSALPAPKRCKLVNQDGRRLPPRITNRTCHSHSKRRLLIALLVNAASRSSDWRGAPNTASVDGRCGPRCPVPSSVRSGRAADCPACSPEAL
jgi:hypothetical protein